MWSNFVPSIPRYLSLNWLPVFGLHFGLMSSQKTLETVSFISFVPRRPTSFAGFAGRYLNVQDNAPTPPRLLRMSWANCRNQGFLPPANLTSLPSPLTPSPLCRHSFIHSSCLSFVCSFIFSNYSARYDLAIIISYPSRNKSRLE